MKCLCWGSTSDQRPAWPEVVPNLAMRCLYGGEGWGHLGAGGTSDQRSGLPKVVPHLAMSLWGWGKGWGVGILGAGGFRGIWSRGGTSDKESTCPKVVPHLALRCLYEGGERGGVLGFWEQGALGGFGAGEVHLTKSQPVQSSTKPHHKMPLLVEYVWPKVCLTWSISKLGHEMSLLGVHLTEGQPDMK